MTVTDIEIKGPEGELRSSDPSCLLSGFCREAWDGKVTNQSLVLSWL